MSKHLRAITALFLLTVVVSCVLYPGALWLVGRAVFPTRAEGSLIVEGGKARGSRLIAQSFTKEKYFRPRPSAVGYNGAGSGGSNWGASNPLLRDRVAREVGRVARFRNGDRVGPVVQAWFVANPGLLGRWAEENPALAARWVKDGDNANAVRAWLATQPDLLPDKADPQSANLDEVAVAVLKRFAQLHPAAWPAANKAADETFSLDVVAVGKEDFGDLQSVLFDPWLAAHPERGGEIQRVPADLVMASGSGLDPHITLRAAKYQLPDVVAARAAETGLSGDAVRPRIEALIEKHSGRPLLLLGEPLVNVLELNAALDGEFGPG